VSISPPSVNEILVNKCQFKLKILDNETEFFPFAFDIQDNFDHENSFKFLIGRQFNV